MKVRFKILVTAIAGGITYLLTSAAGQAAIWQLTMAVFVAGIVLVALILIDLNLAVSELYTGPGKSRLRADDIDRLVAASASIDSADVVLRRFADHELSRLAQTLDGLREGWAVYEGEDRDWLLNLTECAFETIDATSMTSFDAPGNFADAGLFWATDLGRHYLARQRQAITERHVAIRRIFLIDDASDAGEDWIDDLVKPHKEIGVRTRVLRSSQLDSLTRTDLYDFIVFDGRLSYELRAASAPDPDVPPLITSVTLVADWRVEDRKRRFEQMWNDAADR
ncbi:hypothetical protein [Winogradskya humida]|uniref:hypothetical protein n=1 Tax=Winogradskya humida TaxID=113566 RepID=UPI00194281E1|nr:hypothetical protein [Actinoplanes humidus]